MLCSPILVLPGVPYSTVRTVQPLTPLLHCNTVDTFTLQVSVMTTTTMATTSESATKVELGAVGISPDVLASMLSSSSSSTTATTQQTTPAETLVIDSRPFMSYNDAHVVGAINAHCPSIIKRRSGGFVALEYIVPDTHQRQQLLEGACAAVVVYDQSTTDLASADADSNLYSVVKSLMQQVPDMEGRVFYLVGGYEAFSEECPVLCATPQFSVMTNGRCDVQSGATADDQPVEILSHVYLGSGQHAQDLHLLQRLGVTALVNVSTSCPNHHPQHFHYLTIPVRDSSSEDLLSWFHTANTFIDEVRSQGGRVLVHCQAGRSRSATVCLAYLMRTHSLSLDSAFDHVRSRREVIDPNLNFMRQLQDYRRQLDNEVEYQQQQCQQMEADEQLNVCERLSPVIPATPTITPCSDTPSMTSLSSQSSSPFVRSPSPFNTELFHSAHSSSVSPSVFSGSLSSSLSPLFRFSVPSPLPPSRSSSPFTFSLQPPNTPREAPAPISLPSNLNDVSLVPPANSAPRGHHPPSSPAMASDVHCFFAFPEPHQTVQFSFTDHMLPLSSPDLPESVPLTLADVPSLHSRSPDVSLPRTPEITLSS